MPLSSVDEAFRELLRRIELNESRVALASQRYSAVKATIESALPGKSIRQVGSFQRKTKIRPADLSDRLDVDAVVSFGHFYQYAASNTDGVTPSKALDIVRRALGSNQIYRVMPQQLDHPIVRLEYADQMAIELIPAYEDHTGQFPRPAGQPACYIVGTSSGSWRAADYDYDAQTISTLNASSDTKLVPTIKLVKAYLRNATVPLKSFHTEILVANIIPSTITDWRAKHYSYGYHHLLATFLSQASRAVTTPVTLQGSYSPPTNSGLSQSTLASVGTFLAARAEFAWKLCADTSLGSALAGWREFFGDGFPA
jgi:Second Messenger Oligonucleotide or Dinucleotide Synthetase domain